MLKKMFAKKTETIGFQFMLDYIAITKIIFK